MKEYLECIVKLQYGVEVGDRKELVRCKNCRHRDPEDNKCDCGGIPWDTQVLPVPDDWFCPKGERAVK